MFMLLCMCSQWHKDNVHFPTNLFAIQFSIFQHLNDILYAFMCPNVVSDASSVKIVVGN